MSFVEIEFNLEFFIIFHILNASTFSSFKKNHFLVGITIEDVQTYVLVVALGIELYFKLVGSCFLHAHFKGLIYHCMFSH